MIPQITSVYQFFILKRRFLLASRGTFVENPPSHLAYLPTKPGRQNDPGWMGHGDHHPSLLGSIQVLRQQIWTLGDQLKELLGIQTLHPTMPRRHARRHVLLRKPGEHVRITSLELGSTDGTQGLDTNHHQTIKSFWRPPKPLKHQPFCFSSGERKAG